MEEAKTESPKLSDWLSYHRLLVDDIKYAKSQQWRLAYYTLLLLAAIIGLSKTLGSGPEVKIILFVTSLALAVAGTYFLRKFQKDLTRYRQNISKVREKFPLNFKKSPLMCQRKVIPPTMQTSYTCSSGPFGWHSFLLAGLSNSGT